MFYFAPNALQEDHPFKPVLNPQMSVLHFLFSESLSQRDSSMVQLRRLIHPRFELRIPCPSRCKLGTWEITGYTVHIMHCIVSDFTSPYGETINFIVVLRWDSSPPYLLLTSADVLTNSTTGLAGGESPIRIGKGKESSI